MITSSALQNSTNKPTIQADPATTRPTNDTDICIDIPKSTTKDMYNDPSAALDLPSPPNSHPENDQTQDGQQQQQQQRHRQQVWEALWDRFPLSHSYERWGSRSRREREHWGRRSLSLPPLKRKHKDTSDTSSGSSSNSGSSGSGSGDDADGYGAFVRVSQVYKYQ